MFYLYFFKDKVEALNQALVNEYEVRRKMLLKRLDVTVQSFGWSERAKVPQKPFSLLPRSAAASTAMTTSRCCLLPLIDNGVEHTRQNGVGGHCCKLICSSNQPLFVKNRSYCTMLHPWTAYETRLYKTKMIRVYKSCIIVCNVQTDGWWPRIIFVVVFVLCLCLCHGLNHGWRVCFRTMQRGWRRCTTLFAPLSTSIARCRSVTCSPPEKICPRYTVPAVARYGRRRLVPLIR